MAERALAGHPGIVEAPTGTGKTLAYLAAALALTTRGERVTLVTAFKNLQDQLVDEFAGVANGLGLRTQLAVLKGGDNYFCRRRLERAAGRLEGGPMEARFVLAALWRLVEVENSATREDVSAWLLFRFPTASALLDEVSVGCGHDRCGRQQAIDRANAADLVVLNQVHWCNPPQDLQPTSRVVIDEAHDLEEMATLAFTEDVSASALRSLINRLEPAGRPGLLSAVRHGGSDVAGARQLVRRLRAAIRDAWTPLARFANAISPEVDLEDGGTVRLKRAPRVLHPGAWTRAGDALREIQDVLKQLGGELFGLASAERDRLAKEDLEQLAGRALELEELLWRLTAVTETALVHFLEIGEPETRQWRFARAPVDVAPLLQPRWDALAGYLLVSATLSAGPVGFGFVVDRLGLRGRLTGGTHALAPDFHFEDQVLLGVARWFESIPVRRFVEEFQQEVASEVTELGRFGDGRLLALFTARSRLRAVADAVAEPLAAAGLPLLVQGHGARAALLEEFRARPESVLLGTRSFWQGVDVPGESLTFLVIEKLPFPHLRDPVTEARLELVRRQGGNEFEDYLLPSMTIGFKQGFGRLIRKHDDRGVVLLLDRRFHTKGYRERVLSALPGYRREADSELDQATFYDLIDRTFPGLISQTGRQHFPEPTGISARRGLTELPSVPSVGDRNERRPAVVQALEELFGFAGFRSPEQEELFWTIHDGAQVIGLLPTGAGKSLPFQLSSLIGGGVTLVISPLIALMRDQVEQLLDRGIRHVGALVGQMTADERDEVLRRAGTGAIKLLYVAPERLRDPVFLDRLRSLPVRRVIVDEAHCVSLWGPSFRPDFLAIRETLDATGHDQVPIAALTATATPEIESDIRGSLRLEAATKVATPFGRPELRLAVLGADPNSPGDSFSNDKDRQRLLLRILTAADRRGEPAIVYVPTVSRAEQLAAQLQQAGLVARSYHGRLDSWSRQNVEELFRDSEIDIVVATKAFGMGIDRADVRYVLHVGFPADLESYYQEAGRAGRDGRESWCLLLPLAERDRRTQEWFIEQVTRLDEPLRETFDEISRLGAGRHLVDLQRMAEDLGLEETQARIVLHYLEACGAIARSADQSVEASILILEDVSDSDLGQALRRDGVVTMTQSVIDLRVVAERESLDVDHLEERLIAASRRGEIVYRPIRRHAVITVHAALPDLHPDTRQVTARMHAKLGEMESYATTRRECRQRTIRRYLGEQVFEDCGVCDVCDPTMPRPWLDVPYDEVPMSDRLLSPQLTCLYAIQWNAAEVDAGRAPYGRSALTSVLAGDRFSLTRFTEGRDRERRIRRAEASPYWGALSLVSNPTARIGEALDDLVTLEEIEHVTYDAGSGRGGVQAYEYLRPTERGRARLERGLVEA